MKPLLYLLVYVTGIYGQRVTFGNGVQGRFSRRARPALIEKLALTDTVGREWLGFGRKRMATKAARKFAQLKTMILTYQKWQSFGKFDYYGCHCFSEGMNLAYGKGAPVDEIDTACKKWMSCYQCAETDSRLNNATNSCLGNEQKYKFFADRDQDGLPLINCDLNGGHDKCSRAICECDAELITSLSVHEDDFKLKNHRRWGNLRMGECTAPAAGKRPDIQLKSADQPKKELSIAQESIQVQFDSLVKEYISPGLIDSCCVQEYPKIQLYRSASQHCCMSEIDTKSRSSVFSYGTDKDGNQRFFCCKDGSIARFEEDCPFGLHSEF